MSMSEVFWVGLYTSAISFLIVIIRFGYKSKCKSCSFCGMSIERSVDLEEKFDELEIQRSKSLGNNSLDESKK